MIITLIAVLHIKFAAMSSIIFCIAANTCFQNFLSHYNTIVTLQYHSNKCLKTIYLRKHKSVVFVASRCQQYVINFRKICVHVRKPVDHLVTTSAHCTCRAQATNTFPSYLQPVPSFYIYNLVHYRDKTQQSHHEPTLICTMSN